VPFGGLGEHALHIDAKMHPALAERPEMEALLDDALLDGHGMRFLPG
jgi:hypothetical protein